MAKLPHRSQAIVLPGVLTFLMTFFVSGISTVRAIGLAEGFLPIWMSSWMISWLVAFPVMVAIMPFARRIVAAITDPPER
jgi:hypothetical protein